MLIKSETSSGRLVASLRTEVASARTCFREMASQAVTFAVTATGTLMWVATPTNPYPAFAALGVVFLLMSVQRIGIHKFSTANRLLGYQLHLERIPEAERGVNAMGWEESLRAWRNVQPTLFTNLYRTPQNWFTRLPLVSDFFLLRAFRHREDFALVIERAHDYIANPNHRRVSLPTIWWMQAERAELAGGEYHAGSYLERMFTILSCAQVFAFAPLVLVVAWHESANPLGNVGRLAAVSLIVLLMSFALNWRSLRRRREILEREFLSIQSCAIVWKIVTLAHDLAWNRATEVQRREYTERLAHIGVWLCTEFYRIREFSDLQSFPTIMADRLPDHGELVSSFIHTEHKERRRAPREDCANGLGRDVICDLKGQRIPALLLDHSKNGCRIRLGAAAPTPATVGDKLCIEAVITVSAGGPTALDRLGGFTRSADVVAISGEHGGTDLCMRYR